MNIAKALQLVGRFPVVEGFWKTFLLAVGIVGFSVSLFPIFVFGIINWATLSLAFVFIVMSQLGVFLPWDYLYCCMDARRDIDFFFSHSENNQGGESALNRALTHMTKGTTLERHNVSCKGCWDYYTGMKRKYCGG